MTNKPTTITAQQANEIAENTAKVSMVLGTDADTALAGNTPLYTQAEVDALIANLQSQIDDLEYDGSGTITDQDDNTYEFLTYGNQVWTVENAKMVSYRDNTPIQKVENSEDWADLTIGAWCYYDNDETKPILYNWYAVAGIHDDDETTPNKEFAPEGWHVPTHAEWTELENYLIFARHNHDGTGTGNKIAKAMASQTYWDNSNDTGAVGNNQAINNISGFNAFPEGDRYQDGVWHDSGKVAYFWSSTEDGNNNAYDRSLDYNQSNLITTSRPKKNAFSVRFVKDLD